MIMVVIIGTFAIVGIGYLMYCVSKILKIKVKEFIKNGGIT